MPDTFSSALSHPTGVLGRHLPQIGQAPIEDKWLAEVGGLRDDPAGSHAPGNEAKDAALNREE
ncbi:hypothetical protein ABEW12_16805 [Bacillus licheniformis]